MNIVIVTVMVASVVFLIYFLVVVTLEQRNAPNRLRAHMLNGPRVGQAGKLRLSMRMKLRLLPAGTLQMRNTLSAASAKVMPMQRLG